MTYYKIFYTDDSKNCSGDLYDFKIDNDMKGDFKFHTTDGEIVVHYCSISKVSYNDDYKRDVFVLVTSELSKREKNAIKDRVANHITEGIKKLGDVFK